MALRDAVKISRKTFFNPTGWIDYNGLKEQNRTIYSILRTTFTPAQPEREETFEQAKERLNLTDEDVRTGETIYRYYAIFFAVLGLLTLFYSFYLLFTSWTLTGFLLGLTSTALFLSQAFRFDFWSLQMRRRKLGLTFNDWKASVLGR